MLAQQSDGRKMQQCRASIFLRVRSDRCWCNPIEASGSSPGSARSDIPFGAAPHSERPVFAQPFLGKAAISCLKQRGIIKVAFRHANVGRKLASEFLESGDYSSKADMLPFPQGSARAGLRRLERVIYPTRSGTSPGPAGPIGVGPERFVGQKLRTPIFNIC